jgi:23S rRNA (adenine2503-C2)-methyltransferase
MSQAPTTAVPLPVALGDGDALAREAAGGADSLHILSRLPEDWQTLLESFGERPYRAQQIFRWIFKQGVLDPGKMTNLPLALRERLQLLQVDKLPEVEIVQRAADGTRKLLLSLSEVSRVECVLIPMAPKTAWDAEPIDFEDDDEEESPSDKQARVTLCVSTQYGCAMGCTFCESGRVGLKRSLRCEEIVAQVLLSRAYLEKAERLTNLVLMGMGEPLHNYEATARALRVLSHPEGLDLSLRRITVSTVGLVRGIERLGEDFGGKVGLAVSLHAPNDELRSRIIPINRRVPLRQLMAALRRYPLPRRRRITIEYTLIAGYNDGFEQARQLSELLQGLPVKINLIPMNPIAGSELRASSSARVAEFQDYLARDGYSCFIRTRRGGDVAAACGQLAFRPATTAVSELGD